MAEPKTKPTTVSVVSFLNRVADTQRRADSFQLLEMMKEITGERPRMWGPSIVGFGQYHYVYASGHEGDCCITGFSPRKNALVLYFMGGLEKRFAALLAKLGKFKSSKGCLYIKRLADVDVAVLRDMIRENVAHLVELSNARTAPTKAKKSRKKS
jgi:hypothetical protein